MSEEKRNYLDDLRDEYSAMVSSYGLDKSAVEVLSEFLVEKCRSSWKSGNRSGYRFAMSKSGNAA